MTRGPYAKRDTPSRLRLREARIKAGYTQEAMAEGLGTSQASYARWENGVVEISVKQMLQIAAFLDTPPSELIFEGDGLNDEERALIAYLRTHPVHRKILLSNLNTLKDSVPPMAAE